MITKWTASAIVFGGMFWCTVSSAQDSTPATSPPVAPAASGTASAAPGDEAIHLHMPAHRRARRAAARSTPPEAASIDTIGADTGGIAPPPALTTSQSETPPQAQPASPAQQKPARKGQQQPAPAIPFNFGEDSESSAPPPKAQDKTASLPPKPVIAKEARSPAPTPQTKTASVSAQPATLKRAAVRKSDEHAGLAKRGAVLFAKGVPDPSPAQFTGVKLLAGEIAGALETGARRVQLEAYGGTPGDKSSEARRLALKRALAVRQLLIDNGVPSTRIDVRALGGVDDKGPNDRVDVFLRTS